ncbi:CT583 family protein [Candidatus Chlamydia corallus]|uniref:CT583 family protein n=1 Tax=Candidatus Chlamydia corallus TaxID=2038470 RepID=UPI000C2FF269|nr:CT583 family protein [Candidatus Chlamydia corallus]
MSKLVKEASIFFQKNKKNTEEEFQKKEITKDVFSVSLTLSEVNRLDSLFSKYSFEDRKKDVFFSIKTLTCQIKSIQKQHVLLIGEKIYKVRELLKTIESSDTTFSSWISLVFSTKSSAYNALAYYELFTYLPSKTEQLLLQSIPYKAAYLLASRKGSIERKLEVMKKITGLPNTSAISILNKYLPPSREISLSHAYESDEAVNKIISEKLLDLLRLVSSKVQLSEYNLNLIKQLFDNIALK